MYTRRCTCAMCGSNMLVIAKIPYRIASVNVFLVVFFSTAKCAERIKTDAVIVLLHLSSIRKRSTMHQTMEMCVFILLFGIVTYQPDGMVAIGDAYTP